MDGRPSITRRRGIYLLPNLLTTCGLFAGFYSIVASIAKAEGATEVVKVKSMATQEIGLAVLALAALLGWAAYSHLSRRPERAKLFGGAFTNVRAGLIVGPHDPTDRFTYWPRRVARGGPVRVRLDLDAAEAGYRRRLELLPDDPRAAKVVESTLTLAELLTAQPGWAPPSLGNVTVLVVIVGLKMVSKKIPGVLIAAIGALVALATQP